jgi:protein ImuB
MCIWLANWPIQRLRRLQPTELGEQPLVLYAPAGQGKPLVSACSSGAARQGVRVGMPVAEARALTAGPGGSAAVRCELHDRQADRAGLRNLAGWCQRFSPLVGIEHAEQPDSILLDITGCELVFGGEEALALKAAADFRLQGYWVRVAVADTIGAAWALAHHGEWRVATNDRFPSPLTPDPSPLLVPPGRQAEALRPLVVEALRLSGQVVRMLSVFDVRRIGQLLALPRADLAARFEREVLLRLDQALGSAPEPLVPEWPDEPPLEASRQFEPPVTDHRVVETVLGQLLQQLLEELRQGNTGERGVRSLLCSLQTTQGQPIHIAIGLLRPSTSARHLMELLRLRLEGIRVPAEVSAVALRLAVTVPLEFHQGQLFEADAGPDRWKQLPVLIERLSNRLGEQSVLRPRLWPDAQPELAWRSEPWLRNERREATARPSPLAPRPSLARPPCLASQPVAIRVVSVVPGGPPLRFWWKNHSHVVAHSWGPERIETGWWRDRDVRRDYYLAETTTGKRYWLFRTRGEELWFLQGMFG